MSDMFHSAALKLTAWYLALIMLLSIGSSFALYYVSDSNLEHDVNRQVGFFNGFLGQSDITNYASLRQQQLNVDRAHLRGELLFFNVVVLLAGGAASYVLARRTLRPIEESHEAQVRFAGDASHELRTPLTAMQSEIEVALRNPTLTKAAAVELLKSNLEEVAKLRALSDGLLNLSKGGDKPEDFGQAVSVKDITEQAVERVAKAAKAKRVKLLNSAKDLTVKGNHQNLVDLVAIILDNAIKYSPAGSEVRIDSSAQDKKVRVVVSDEGQGIAAAELPNIFERFYRADDSRSKNKSDGYGLGLALAKKIAELHNGSIEVRSVQGKGSVFTIVLPRA